MATHSSILAWRAPWTEEPGELQSVGSKRDTTEQLTLSLFFLQDAPYTVLGALDENNFTPLIRM